MNRAWIERIRTLPLIPVTLDEPKDFECIDEQVWDGRVIMTHQFIPHHRATYIASISGLTSTRKKICNIITDKLSKTPYSVHKSGNCWMVCWESGDESFPIDQFERVVGKKNIDGICQAFGVKKANMDIVYEMLALAFYFRLKHQSDGEKYLNTLTKDFSEAEKNAISTALREIYSQFALHSNN